MKGTNTASFNGLPPTNLPVALPGADFIRVEGDRILSVQGYFDGGAVPRQLGLDVIVQPKSIGPFSFGISTRATTGKHRDSRCLRHYRHRSPHPGGRGTGQREQSKDRHGLALRTRLYQYCRNNHRRPHDDHHGLGFTRLRSPDDEEQRTCLFNRTLLPRRDWPRRRYRRLGPRPPQSSTDPLYRMRKNGPRRSRTSKMRMWRCTSSPSRLLVAERTATQQSRKMRR